MAEQNVSIVIDALNRTKGVIETVSKELAGLGPAAAHAGNSLNQAQRHMHGAESAAMALTHHLKEIAAAMVAGFTVEKLVELTVESMHAAHEAELLGQAVGMTADEMFRMGNIAARSNVDTGQFGFSMRGLAKALVDAQDPMSKEAQIFKDMGIASRDSSGHLRQAKDVLFDLMDAFKSYAATPERAALANELFGRSGQRMIGFLTQGSEELKRKMAETTGITEEQEHAAQAFVVMQSKIKALATELGLTIGAAVVPYLSQFVDWIGKSVKGSNEWKTSLEAIGQVAKGVAATIGLVAAGLANMVDTVGTLSRIAGTIKESASGDFTKGWIERIKDSDWYHDLLNQGRIRDGKQPINYQKKATDDQAGLDIAKELAGLRDRAAKRSEDAIANAKSLVGLEEKHADVEKKIEEHKAESEKHDQAELKIAPLVIDRHKLVGEELKKIEAERTKAESTYQLQLLQTQALAQSGVISQREAFERDKAAAGELVEKLKEVNAELRGLADAHTDMPELQVKVDQSAVQQQQTELASNAPSANDWSEQWKIAMQEMNDEFALTAQKIAQTFRTVVKGAISTVADGVTDAIYRTKTWNQALLDIEKTIGRSIVNAIVKMFTEWIAQRAIMGLANILWSAKEGAADVAAKTPGALMSSISSWGIAAAVGTAALVAAMAAMGAFAEGGPVTGGTPGKDSVAAWLMPGEFVIPTHIVNKMGAGYFEEYRQGRIPERGRTVASAPAPNRSGFFAAGGIVADAGLMNAPAPQVHVVVVDNEKKARDYMDSAQGEQTVLKHLKNNRTNLGMA